MKHPFFCLRKKGIFFLFHLFLIFFTSQASAGEQNANGEPASNPKVEAFDAEKDEVLLQTSKRALEEMRKHENQETIDNFIEAGVKIAARLSQGGHFGSAYKLLATIRNVLVEKRAKGFCFDQNEDSFILMASSVSSALEIPDLGNAYYGATLFRKEIFDLLQKGGAVDPEALRLLDRHLYCLANKFVKKSEELVAIRTEMLEKLPGSGRFQNLRNLLRTENIRELGQFYLWDDDYKNADKVFAIGENNGDNIAKANRIGCSIYLNRMEGMEKKLGESLQSSDFRTVFDASASYLLWQQASGDIDSALKTVQKMQGFLDEVKKADMKDVGHGTEDIRYANRLVLYQYRLSTSKIRLFALQKDIKAIKSEAELIQDIILTWSSACMSPSSTEQQRLRFKESIGSTPFDIWYLAGEPEKLAANLALYKGMVMDSLVQDATVVDTSEYIAKGYPTDLAEDMVKVKSGIFKGALENLKNIRHENVLAALPEKTAFVDFAKVSGVDERGFSEDRYVALIYPQRGKTSFEIVELGLAKMIEDKISLFLALVESSHEDPKLETVARELSQLLVSPWIYKIDPQKEELILCPDGALTFLNFGALPDSGGKFLAEKIKVNYVSAARDIVSPVVLEKVFAGGSKPQVGIFVDPDFKAPQLLKVKELIASRRSTVLHRLPEARLESSAVKEAFQEIGANIHVFSDSEATESRLRSSGPYWILHLGTHGFFNKYATKNPMKGAGLALAGAYPNLKTGLNSEYDDNPDDGVLTAEEISKQDLKSCWLVSVSACQSGMGQSLDGEGVLGLRRGFYRAGVMNVLLCLWPIGDKDARAFIENFYALVKSDMPLKDAYPKTVAKMLRQQADEKGITYAIRATGPFIMSSIWKKYPKQ